jgi:hypothetical protein
MNCKSYQVRRLITLLIFNPLKSLLKVLNEILNIFNPDRHANQVFSHPHSIIFLLGIMLIDTRPVVAAQGLGVSNIGRHDDQLEGIDQLLGLIAAPLETESDDRTEAPLQIFQGQLVIWMVVEPEVADPCHPRVGTQPAS